MKLGLKYIRVGVGITTYPTVNGGDWDKNSYFPNELANPLTDAGVPLDDTNKKTLLYKFIPEGCLFCWAKRIKVRSTSERSNEALWIFVPAAMDIKPTEIKAALTSTFNIFRNDGSFPDETTFRNEIPPIFQQEFPSLTHPRETDNMKAQAIAAINCVGEYSIDKIIELGYQKEFADYGLIILNTKAGGTSSVPLLNPVAFKKTIYLSFPQALSEVRGLAIRIDGAGFGPDGGYFTTGTHKVKLLRSGYVPIETAIVFQPTDDNHPLPLPNDKIVWRKEITPGFFTVKDSKTGRQISDFKVIVNDPEYDRATRSLPVDRFGKVDVKITAEGYGSFTGTVDLSVPPVEITLEKGKEEKAFIYQGRKGNLNVTIEGPGALSMEPLEGYRVQNGRLIFRGSERGAKQTEGSSPKSGGFDLKTFCIGFISGVIIVVLLAWILNMVGFLGTSAKSNNDNVSDSAQDREQIVGNPTQNGQNNTGQTNNSQSLSDVVTPNDDRNAAIAYLDQDGVNAKWDKDVLDSFEATKGLFDEMNLRKFTDILKRRETLSGSQNFSNLLFAIQQNQDKNITAKFLDDKDTSNTITLQKYIDNLNNAENKGQSLKDHPKKPNEEKKTDKNRQQKDNKPNSGAKDSGSKKDNGSQRGGL